MEESSLLIFLYSGEASVGPVGGYYISGTLTAGP